ncbi:MAG TPA: VOC family protein [Thermoplasmata archaeon]|nr:VOC family protein [Thermoplasmata archaeon]
MPTRRSVRFLYSGIRVRDLDRSLRFYRALGFKVHARGRMGHGGKWVHLVFPGSRHRLELNYYPRENRFYEPFRPGSEFDHFGFHSPDVIGWRRRAIRAGGRVVEDFVDGRSRLIYVNDPDGVCLEVFGPARPRRRAARRKKRS